MNRVLFLENRHQTRTWEAVAAELAPRGYEVSWLVMNHGFTPTAGTVHCIPYPGAADFASLPPQWAHIASTDRAIKYWKRPATHYDYYARAVESVLDSVQPDLVIGEATQFYELLTIEFCRQRRIPYIVPATARYPTGRFLFYLYDTLQVLAGSGEDPEESQVIDFIESVVQRKVVPDYMKQVGVRAARPSFARRWRDRAYKGSQYLRGERFSSPPLLHRLALDRKIPRQREAWDALAAASAARLAEPKTRVLFPLHMQPESSVDVWGRRYHDQVALAGRLADALDDDAQLLIKSNPKPGCELSPELLALAAQHPRVVALGSATNMQQAAATADVILTITGTVAIECILARKPCVTLVETRNNGMAGCVFLSAPEEIAAIVALLRGGLFPMHSVEEIRAFARMLFTTSYPGVILDPFLFPEVNSPENVERLAHGFLHLLRSPELRAAVPGHATVS